MTIVRASRLTSYLALSLCLGAAACADEDPSASALEESAAALKKAAASINFIVVYKQQAVPASAANDIANAGGTLLASYPLIGVAVASSNQASFLSAMGGHPAVESVAPTNGAGISALPTKKPTQVLPPPALPAPDASGDALSGMQWNMAQIHAADARAINPGSKSVVVGVLDSGIDDSLPDLQGQVDPARSVTCIGGVPNSDPEGWRYDSIGHGSHVAGVIAASENGVGTVGVAPGVTLAALKVTEDGFVYPEAVICGIYWAATHGVDLVNASLITDPWYYNCETDPTQRTLKLAQQRAVSFAASRRTTVIAAASNENQDLANPTLDPFSPLDAKKSEPRPVDASCKVLPVGLDHVIGVSALAGDEKLSFYSNYGLGAVDFAAPGGDFNVAMPGNASGQILSPIPAYSYYYQIARDWNGRVAVGCADGLDANSRKSDPSTCAETYALLQGTSQAVPHVTGVAALAVSRYGKLSPAQLHAALAGTADPLACPSGVYQPYPALMPAEVCEGSSTNNGFYGRGRVDALDMVD